MGNAIIILKSGLFAGAQICVVVVAVGTVAWFVLPPDATTAGWLTGWEISIDSRRQKLAILLNVCPSVRPPSPSLALPLSPSSPQP